MIRRSLLLVLTTTLFVQLEATSTGADAVNPAEAKLRESLRAALLQARTAESERAALQGTVAENEQMILSLKAEIEKLGKEKDEEKAKAVLELQEMQEKIKTLDAQIVTLNKSLESWKKGHQEISDIARATEAKRAKLEAEVIVLKRRVAEQQTKNEGMFAIGNEILARYEKFGLGEALTAREPFVGITRVKFETLMQDYTDKLEDQRIKPPEKKPASAKAKTEKASADKAKP